MINQCVYEKNKINKKWYFKLSWGQATPFNYCGFLLSIIAGICLSPFFGIIFMSGSVIYMENKTNLKLFDIDDSLVSYHFIDLKDDHYHIYMDFISNAHCCPFCGSIKLISKGYYKKNLVSVPINDRHVTIHARFKRIICNDCNVSFSDHHSIYYVNTKFTRTAIVSILKRLKPYNVTYSQVARDFGVSTQKIVDIFDMFVRVKRKHLPRILLIDEFHFSRHSKYKYPVLLMNFENKVIIDVVESRRHEIFSTYLYSINKKEREEVEYICTDMSSTFRTLIHTYFPNSSHIVDHFHVTRLVNDQLNNTRKRIMRKYSKNKNSNEYKILKNKYRLLLKCQDDIDNETYKYDHTLEYHCTENTVLQAVLNIDEDIRKAYQAKEEYLAFDQCTKAEIADCDKRQEFDSLIKKFKHINVEEFCELADSLSNWKEEILRSFIWIDDRRISNGPIEGKNNYIKKIISNANGMANFKRARNRIIYSQNKYETFSLLEHRDSIKTLKKEKDQK